MAKDWKNEIKEIVSSQHNNIKNVIIDRQKREEEKLKEIDDIKKIIKPRFEFVKDLIEKDKYLISAIEENNNESTEGSSESAQFSSREVTLNYIGSNSGNINVDEQKRIEFIESAKRGEKVSVPKISEGPAEMVLIMPNLSEVNRLDLMYQIEFKDDKPVLHSFNLLSSGKMINNGSAHGKYEDFVQDTLKRFLLSWFTRKEGTELDKERTFKLIIEGHGLKP